MLPQSSNTSAENTHSGGLKARAGRRTGRQRRQSTSNDLARPAAQQPRRLPLMDLLDEAQLCRLESHSEWILKEIGMEFRGDPEALELFRQSGASVDGERVRFEPGLARSLCAHAPTSFTMHARDTARSIVVGNGSLSLTPGYGSPFVTDMDQGRRYATLEDFRNFVRLSWQTPWLHHSGGTVCEPVDVPVNKRHLDMVYSHLKDSAMPFMGSVTAPERAEDSIAMAELVFGSDFMARNCVIQGNININSPLVLDSVMSGALKVYARANQCNFISPFLLSGAMGPVTMPALIAQAHAETMATIALSQLVRKGSPVIYGNFLTALDLRSGAPVFGAPEANLAIIVLGQLCRRLNLPLRGIGHVTASKCADAQAMQESVDSMNAAIQAGSDIVFHAAGWLEGGLTMGYEKFMLDVDRCGMTCHMIEGLQVDEESLAIDAYHDAGPGQNFLSVPHTLRNFRNLNYESSVLSDTLSFEQWRDSGNADAATRANRSWKKCLAEYQAPPLDEAIDEALTAFVQNRKDSMPDQWY